MLQVERLGVISSSLESARLNQGLTDRFIEWTEGELVKISIGLESASLRAERLESGRKTFVPIENISSDANDIAKEMNQFSGRLE